MLSSAAAHIDSILSVQSPKMSATYYFAIVGTNDNPLYETELSSSSKSTSNFDASTKDDHRHLNQFIIHSALDVVEEVQWNNQTPYESCL